MKEPAHLPHLCSPALPATAVLCPAGHQTPGASQSWLWGISRLRTGRDVSDRGACGMADSPSPPMAPQALTARKPRSEHARKQDRERKRRQRERQQLVEAAARAAATAEALAAAAPPALLAAAAPAAAPVGPEEDATQEQQQQRRSARARGAPARALAAAPAPAIEEAAAVGLLELQGSPTATGATCCRAWHTPVLQVGLTSARWQLRCWQAAAELKGGTPRLVPLPLSLPADVSPDVARSRKQKRLSQAAQAAEQWHAVEGQLAVTKQAIRKQSLAFFERFFRTRHQQRRRRTAASAISAGPVAGPSGARAARGEAGVCAAGGRQPCGCHGWLRCDSVCGAALWQPSRRHRASSPSCWQAAAVHRCCQPAAGRQAAGVSGVAHASPREVLARSAQCTRSMDAGTWPAV